MNPILAYAYRIPGGLIAITVHEFIRALVSTLLGDELPKREKRLTVNPLKHFEPIGFILLLTTGLGWGKPVKTSALYYKKRKRDLLITAIAPTLANLLIALLCLYALTYMPIEFVPLHSVPASMRHVVFYLTQYAMYVNVSLAVFNIIPVSPMDALKVLSAVLPPNTYMRYLNYEKTIQIIVFLLLFAGVLNGFFQSLTNLVLYALTLLVF